MKHSITSLIKCYVQTSNQFVQKLQDEFGQYNLLCGWRSGAIPQEGVLLSGETFRFHGVGCEFVSQQATIDINFGPDGRCDGFDSNHLWRFATSNDFADGWTLGEISQELEQLLKKGLIECPGWNPTPQFCYLVRSK